MTRTSKRKDAEREEGPLAEKPSEIISFEPILQAANEKFVRIAGVMGIKRDGYVLHIYSTWVVPRIAFVPCLG